MRAERGRLLRVLGVAFGWAVIVGNMIGAGILRTPGDVAGALPELAPYFAIWLLGGVYALLGALSLAELGAMIAASGGQTVFVRRAFGAYPGFVVAWSDWISTCASTAAITIVLVEAVSVLVPGWTRAETVLAVAIILMFTAAQWRGVRTGSTIQTLTSGAKTVAFAALIVACFLAPAQAQSPPATATTFSAAAIVVALQAVIFTYDGWTGVLYFSGEVESPGRDIPRAMVSGVLSVIAIYLLLNMAFVRLLPLPAMAGDPLVADSVSQMVFGNAGGAILRALIAISLLSAINAILLMSSRVLYALGDAGVWPRAATVNAGGTPTFALGVSAAVTLLFVTTGTFQGVIALAAFFFVANYTASFASVFWLRRTEPDTLRPYRAWGYPVSTALVLAGSVAFLAAAIVADSRSSAYSIALLLLSYPVFRIISRRRRDKV